MTRLALMLLDTDNVWVQHVEFGATGHRSNDKQTAVCGAQVLQWPVAAGQLTRLCGQLCSRCWPSSEPSPRS